MSVVRLEEIYYGLAGDTKPATASDGAIYIARDTGGMWQRQDGAWWGLNPASGKWLYIPVNAGLTTAVVDSGTAATNGSMTFRLSTGANASSSARAQTLIASLSTSGEDQQVDFTKRMRIQFQITRVTTVANAVARLWLGDLLPTGAATDKTLGIYIANLTLSGQAYGSAEATVDLTTTMTTSISYRIDIFFDPNVPRIQWFVNGVLKGTQTTAANIPTAQSGNCSFQAGVINGATATNAIFDFGNIHIWQENP